MSHPDSSRSPAHHHHHPLHARHLEAIQVVIETSDCILFSTTTTATTTTTWYLHYTTRHGLRVLTCERRESRLNSLAKRTRVELYSTLCGGRFEKTKMVRRPEWAAAAAIAAAVAAAVAAASATRKPVRTPPRSLVR